MEFKNVGQIASIKVPEDWTFSQEEANESIAKSRWKISLHPLEQPTVEIAIFYRGQPVDLESMEMFRDLIATKPGFSLPEKVTPPEIAALTFVMGLSTAGDNQYTNPTPRPETGFPVFDLRRAETFRLNGRTVLSASGTFYNLDGEPSIEYEGIFYEGKDLAIEEVFLCTAAEQVREHVPVFHEILSSIVWR